MHIFIKKSLSWSVLLILGLLPTRSVLGQHAVPARPLLPPGLDQDVETVLNVFDVPGLALTVVSGDEVLLTKGYGVRKMGEPGAVDAKTLFPIASNSKAFTGAALTMLVDQGKIAWHDPVINYLPWFRLSDPYVTRELTIEDLLVHRSGI